MKSLIDLTKEVIKNPPFLIVLLGIFLSFYSLINLLMFFSYNMVGLLVIGIVIILLGIFLYERYRPKPFIYVSEKAKRVKTESAYPYLNELLRK